jgi:UDP-glucose 4-epimerase
MKILILGSEGYIGRHLVSFYLNQNAMVFGADLHEAGSQNYNYFKTSRLSPEFDELLSAESFDACINAAGSGNVNYSMTHPVSDFEANSLDTIRLLDVLRRHQPQCRYLHISSAAVYGNPDQLPIAETNELKPISPYGWHKLISENICREYTSVYKVPTAIVRPFSVYGPGLKKQLFWDLYQKWLKASDQQPIDLWGTGKESRDFIFITDLVSAFDCVLRDGKFSGEVYNVASGVELTIEDVAEKFVDVMGKKAAINFTHRERSGDPQNWRVDISKIRALGFKPSIDITTGIQALQRWLKDSE